MDLLVEKKKYCHFNSVSDSFFKNFLYLESFCSQVNYGVLDSLRLCLCFHVKLVL